MPLTSPQYKNLSEIFGNVSVAWFTAGIVSPLFLNETRSDLLVLYLVLGISMFVVFAVISMFFSGKVKND